MGITIIDTNENALECPHTSEGSTPYVKPETLERVTGEELDLIVLTHEADTRKPEEIIWSFNIE